jgi:hypothetical protein
MHFFSHESTLHRSKIATPKMEDLFIYHSAPPLTITYCTVRNSWSDQTSMHRRGPMSRTVQRRKQPFYPLRHASIYGSPRVKERIITGLKAAQADLLRINAKP